MRKCILFTVLFSLAASTTVFAGGQQQGSASNKETVSFWTISLKSHFGSYIQGMINAYEAKHSNVTIDWQDVPGPQVTDKYLAAFAAGDPPDVSNNYNIAELISKGAVLDVMPYLTASEKAQYIPKFLKSFQFGSKIYALPWYTETHQLVYSQKILDEAGIAAPPTNLAEVLRDGQIIHQKTGKYGFEPVLTGHKNWIIGQLAADGIPLLSPDRKKAVFDTPAAQHLLSQLKKGYKDGAIAPESINASLDDGTQDFLQGQAAFFDEGPWVFDRTTPKVVKELGWKVSYGIKGKVGFHGNAQELVVSKTTKHPRQAVQFATYVTNGPNELAFCKLVAIYPGDLEPLKAPYFTTETPKNDTQKYQQLGAKQLVDTVVAPWNAPPVPQWNEMSRDFGQKIAAIFTSNASIPETLKSIQDDWNKILSSN